MLLQKKETKFRDEYIKFHGNTLGKLFVILHGIVKKWNQEQGAMNYPYLQEIVIEEIKEKREKMWGEILDSLFEKSHIIVYDENAKPVMNKEEFNKLDIRSIDSSIYEKTQ